MNHKRVPLTSYTENTMYTVYHDFMNESMNEWIDEWMNEWIDR